MNLEFWNNKKIRYGIIAAILLLIAVITFIIRMVPFNALAGSGDMIAGPDAWYNLRLVETALANGFSYLSFEAFTLFPTGDDIVWGPLFTWISAIFAIIAGAASRVDIVTAVSFVPPVLAVCMVPVMYFLGKKCGDWKTGILAAVFIAVVGGQYMVRSVYGHYDHHIAETLFSTLFCMCYVWSIVALKNHEIQLKSFSTLKLPLIYGAITGIAYCLGLLTMTTLVLFGLIVSVFTLIVFIINQRNGKPTEYLLILNVTTFLVSVICLLIYGIRDFGFNMYTYSLGLIMVNFMVVIGTVVLYLLALGFKKLQKPWYFYFLTLVGAIIVLTLGLMLVLPDVFNSSIASLSQFFINNDQSATIQEMSMWTWDGAWSSFNWSIILSIGGIICLVLSLRGERKEESLFVLIWSVIMLIGTCSHMRWEYYIAANFVLLSAIFVSRLIDFAKDDILNLISKKNTAVKSTGKKSKGTPQKKSNYAKIGLAAVAVIIAVVFVGVSASGAANLEHATTNPYWIDACEWLEENTPETGLEYLEIYDKEGFAYPKESYGIVSWWDYGHYITTIGKRIPVANPFQAGVSGKYGVAQILVATDESAVTKKLDYLGAKYVMTDSLMGDLIFPLMTIWADPVNQFNAYYYTFLQRDASGAVKTVRTYSPNYYNALAVRLQNYDGSMTAPGAVNVAYTAATESEYPLISNGEYFADAAKGWQAAETYNADSSYTSVGRHAYVIPSGETDPTKTYYTPSVEVPALTHFRMVSETEKSYVKTYEYVKGAVIKGEGTIQAKITTNTGRTFTYAQKSSNGQFVVPYATGANGSVTASAYTIVESGKTFTVSENAVQNGLSVN